MRFFLSLLLCLFTYKSVLAISIISDDETQTYIVYLLRPIYQAADLPLDFEKVFIVNDNSLNAFVGDRNNMFINTGTILSAKNANEIEGVLAHETGHILGGHILRKKIKMQDIQTATLASLVAAVGAGALTGRGDAAMAIMLGSQSSALNVINAYQLTEERAADETATMLLSKNNKSVAGLKSFMQKVENTNRLQGIEESAYFRTHPVSRERVSFFDNYLKKENAINYDKVLDERLKIIQAKIFAFMAPLDDVNKKIKSSTNTKEILLMNSVYYMRKKEFAQAIENVDKLINTEPSNPYFWELKSQVMFESGNPQQAQIAAYKAYELKPSSRLLAINYADIALENNLSEDEIKSVISLLEKTNVISNYPMISYLLGKAYNQIDDAGVSNYYLAEYYSLLGNKKLAKKFLFKTKMYTLPDNITLKIRDLGANFGI